MGSIYLDIDNSQIKAYINRLKKMHRSDFPLSVRATLNDMAFDVKQRTLLQSADKEFTLRNPSFFKKYSGVKKATGFNINSMKSEVGINPGNSTSARNLTKQELGGRISNRSMIYMDTARISRSNSRRVSKKNYLGTKGIVKGLPNRERGRKSQFIADAYFANKNNLNLLTKNTLYSINSIKFSVGGKNRKVFVKKTPIADYEKNRSVTLKKRPFLKKASMTTYHVQGSLYIKNAKKRIEKSLKG